MAILHDLSLIKSKLTKSSLILAIVSALLFGIFIIISLSEITMFSIRTIMYKRMLKWELYRSSSGTFTASKDFMPKYGYSAELIEDLLYDQEISIVLPV